jgi:DNA replication protein DnaC
VGTNDTIYVRQPTLTLELRANYGRKDVFLHRGPQRDDGEARDDQPPTLLEIVQGVRFLVLDEIGCNPLANDERLLLDELIKHRYEQRKPSILISNLPLDQLKEFLGDALTDRVVDATGNRKFLLQFSGNSYRRTKAENYLEGLA